MDARTEALIYAADRAHHVASLVRPALGRGAIVITDRYLDSSVAYQAGGRELGADEVELISQWAVQGLMPDITVLLDLDPVVAARRKTGERDRLERAGHNFHRRAREAFLSRAAAEPNRWIVIDASASVEDIQGQIRVDVAARLELTPLIEEAEDTVEAQNLLAARDRARALAPSEDDDVDERDERHEPSEPDERREASDA